MLLFLLFMLLLLLLVLLLSNGPPAPCRQPPKSISGDGFLESWRSFGRGFGALGCSWRHVWVTLGACCGSMATFLVILEGLGRILGGLGLPLGDFWEPLGCIWEPLGSQWLFFWCFLSENVKL